MEVPNDPKVLDDTLGVKPRNRHAIFLLDSVLPPATGEIYVNQPRGDIRPLGGQAHPFDRRSALASCLTTMFESPVGMACLTPMSGLRSYNSAIPH